MENKWTLNIVRNGYTKKIMRFYIEYEGEGLCVAVVKDNRKTRKIERLMLELVNKANAPKKEAKNDIQI